MVNINDVRFRFGYRLNKSVNILYNTIEQYWFDVVFINNTTIKIIGYGKAKQDNISNKRFNKISDGEAIYYKNEYYVVDNAKEIDNNLVIELIKLSKIIPKDAKDMWQKVGV